MEMMMIMLSTNISIKMMLMLVLVYGCLESPPPVPSCWLLLHVLVVVGATKVRHSPVVVVTEIHSSSSATIPDVVHPLSRLKIPVKLPGLQGASSSCVASGQGARGEVVVLPGAQHVPVARIQPITAMLVSGVVIVASRKAVFWIIPLEVVMASYFVVTCVIPAPAD